jgi:hypothetical protein
VPTVSVDSGIVVMLRVSVVDEHPARLRRLANPMSPRGDPVDRRRERMP